MQRTLFYTVLTLVAFGILISQIKFIPTWENFHVILVLSIYFTASVIGIIFLVKLWKLNLQIKNSVNWTDRVKLIVISASIISGIPALFFISILSAGQGFFGPSLVNEIKLHDKEIYVYHNNCFPPDSGCECDDYYSLIYIKNQYLPIMHIITKVDFYTDNIQLNKNELLISASKTCPQDIGKTKKVKIYSRFYLTSFLQNN